MTSIKRYFFMVVLAALMATGIFQVALPYLKTDWQKAFMLFMLADAWILGFLRWLWAVITDPRDPLGINDSIEKWR